jgi:hypothetical protein
MVGMTRKKVIIRVGAALTTWRPRNLIHCAMLKYGSTEPLIRALPFWIWCVESALDDGTRSAEIAAALRDNLRATIACGI